MDKEVFISIINKIQELEDKQIKFCSALNELDPDWEGSYIYSDVINFLSNLLTELSNDDKGIIDKYLWSPSIIEKNAIKTPEELYDIIFDEKK